MHCQNADLARGSSDNLKNIKGVSAGNGPFGDAKGLSNIIPSLFSQRHSDYELFAECAIVLTPTHALDHRWRARPDEIDLLVISMAA